MRQTTSAWMVDESAAPTDAIVYTTSAARITGRRPKLSESAPWKRNISPKAKRYAESVCWISRFDAESDCWIPANAGRYASMEKGPSVASAASIAAKAHRKRRVRWCASEVKLPFYGSSTLKPPSSSSASGQWAVASIQARSEEHTSELQSQFHLVCRLLL